MDKANIAVRETEVSRVMGNLSKAVECLTQSIDATEARLTGITRNIPSGTLDKVSEPEYDTTLAQDINKIHNKVQYLRGRLDDLLDRIEL
ncbi:MAG: hypothetical protein GX660_27240 [Clostridiaceae bacterium]|jgi:hypothetical protein|nr:hypothetical protein [Clostridiaceae bacterium]